MKVVVWGTGRTWFQYKHFLKNNIEIVAFVETAPMRGCFLGKKVIMPEELTSVEYDYIVIFSVYQDAIFEKMRQCNISENRAITFNQYGEYSSFVRDPFHRKLKNMRSRRENAKILITGLSYHNEGIDETKFDDPVVNMAMGSQDLFYDYEVAKYVMRTQNGGGISYCIIGMSYYSMEYDYSKSCNAQWIIRYYPEIADAHNMMDSAFFPAYAEKEIRRLSQYEYLSGIFETGRQDYEFSEEEGKRIAQTDFNKCYPLTIFENKCILNEYLTFLEDNHIKPIIVIMPAHYYYTHHVPPERKTLFYKSLNEVLISHRVQVLDYFDTYECPDAHYYHVSHFNEIGASVFTEKLIQDIRW